MIEILSLVVVRVALVVAGGCGTLLAIRHRGDRTTPAARRLRASALWSLGVATVALIVFAVVA